MPMVSDPNEKIVVSKVDARQGTNRPKVIYVLIASIVLIVLAFVLASFFFQHPTHPV